MIADFFFNLFGGFLDWVASLLPDSADIINTGPMDVFRDINYFLPLSEMANVIAGAMVLMIPFSMVTMGLWILVGVVRGGAPRA